MKLENLISYLVNPESLKNLYKEFDTNIDSEAILIYMKDSLMIDSEIHLYTIEETDDEQYFERNGIKYIQLFPVEYAIELIESDLNLKNKKYSNDFIASRFLDYRVIDA